MLSVYWFRRDLRLEDNTALFWALKGKYPVLPVFIFDDNILEELSADDARLGFIYQTLAQLNEQLVQMGSSLLVLKGDPLSSWKKLITEQEIKAVYVNRDYEPYAIARDRAVAELLKEQGIALNTYKDQVVFEGNGERALKAYKEGIQRFGK